MALSFSLYNSTATAIVIDDIPISATVPAHGNVNLDPATVLSDVANSLLLRQYDLSGQVSVTLNGHGLKLSKLGLVVGGGGGGGGGVTSVGATAPITSSGGATPNISTSIATARLVGRSTAGTGVMEQITVGTGLSLSAGTLTASGGTPVDNEVPGGAIDGVNDTFTLAFTPIVGSQHLYKNGIRQKPGAGNDYTISGSTITFEPGNIPIVLDTLIADYRK